MNRPRSRLTTAVALGSVHGMLSHTNPGDIFATHGTAKLKRTSGGLAELRVLGMIQTLGRTA